MRVLVVAFEVAFGARSNAKARTVGFCPLGRTGFGAAAASTLPAVVAVLALPCTRILSKTL